MCLSGKFIQLRWRLLSLDFNIIADNFPDYAECVVVVSGGVGSALLNWTEILRLIFVEGGKS